jgi:hypothetical protein
MLRIVKAPAFARHPFASEFDATASDLCAAPLAGYSAGRREFRKAGP